MQRVVGRAKFAEKMANKARQKKIGQKKRSEGWLRNQTRVRLIRANTAALQQDRKNRREDWACGTLAPRRDVGDKETTYGALSMYDIELPVRDPEQRPRWAPILRGDRVVIVRGRERGKIGKVKGTDYERAAVQVEGLNIVDVQLPKWMQPQIENENDNNEINQLTSVEKYIHLEDVRLVYPLPDPVTGVPRDAIIDKLVETPRGQRAIGGTNTIIPYPSRNNEASAEDVDYDDDTLRMSLEERTFRPSLISPPMPLSVIDELRHRYSRFRTHHDYDYLQRKQAEDAKTEARKGLIKKMRTPLQELADLREKQRIENETQLTDEQLARIGEAIAAEKSRTGADQATTA